MDLTTKAVTLKAANYKENDKMLLLYSLEYGKISVLARGVRKGTAKLKFVAEPFSFAQFCLLKAHDTFILKTATQLEGFFDLRQDIESYVSGCVILDCLASLEEPENPDGKLFSLLLRALRSLLENPSNALKTVLLFLLKYLFASGLTPDLSDSQVKKSVASVITLFDGADFEKLKNFVVPNNQLKDCLAFLDGFILKNTETRLKSLSELLKL